MSFRKILPSSGVAQINLQTHRYEKGSDYRLYSISMPSLPLPLLFAFTLKAFDYVTLFSVTSMFLLILRDSSN